MGKDSIHLCIIIANYWKVGPFKLFGADDDDIEQRPRVLFENNEEEIMMDVRTSDTEEKVTMRLGHACIRETLFLIWPAGLSRSGCSILFPY